MRWALQCWPAAPTVQVGGAVTGQRHIIFARIEKLVVGVADWNPRGAHAGPVLLTPSPPRMLCVSGEEAGGRPGRKTEKVLISKCLLRSLYSCVVWLLQRRGICLLRKYLKTNYCCKPLLPPLSLPHFYPWPKKKPYCVRNVLEETLIHLSIFALGDC